MFTIIINILRIIWLQLIVCCFMIPGRCLSACCRDQQRSKWITWIVAVAYYGVKLYS